MVEYRVFSFDLVRSDSDNSEGVWLMKKQILFFSLLLVFLMLALPVVSATGDEYSPDLKVSRATLNSGTVTIANTGSKNSPSKGFDVMVYYKSFDDTTYKHTYHVNKSIRPGYSRTINNTFQGSNSIKEGLVRVNPSKKFRESNYDNNIRYFKLITIKTSKYTATEQSMYYGGYYWQYTEYSWNYGHAWKNGNSTNCSNGGYSPLLSTNPIATSYQVWGRWGWSTVNEPLYVNAVEIYVPFTKQKRINYAYVSGVANNPNIRVFVDCGFAKFLTYKPSTNSWEAYIKYGSDKLRDAMRIKIYSINTGQTGTDDIVAAAANVKVKVAYMKNSWSWLYD